MELRELHRKVYDYTARSMRDRGRPPTMRDIGKAVGIGSTSHVRLLLDQLEEAGLIERAKGLARGIRLTGLAGDTGPILHIPLRGSIVASQPAPGPDGPTAPEVDDETIDLARNMLRAADMAAGLYALRVKGDSMIDASIHHGDIVVMKRCDQPTNGDLVAAWIKDEHTTTLKRFYREKKRIRLQPANPRFKPIFVRPDNLTVQGKVVLVIRQLDEAQEMRRAA